MSNRNRRKSNILAAILSLVPGLGHFYTGDWRRGLTLLLGLPVQGAIFYAVDLWVLVWLLGIVWAWAVYDAYNQAEGNVTSATLPIVLLLALNLSASWQVTNITVPEFGENQKEVVGNILGGLAHPDFVEEKEETVVATTKYGVPAGKELTPSDLVNDTDAKIVTVPESVDEGDPVTVKGTGFPSETDVEVELTGAFNKDLATVKTDTAGSFEMTFINEHASSGQFFIQANAQTPTGKMQISDTLEHAAPKMLETIYLALIGSAVSVIFAIPMSFFGAKNLMSHTYILRAVYGITRSLFTILRSVEVLIIAVVAVALVGIGPFAGVIALAIHGIGAVGKLYSEAIESIEHGPIEAIRATGANELQVVLYGVVPQVVPQFIAFTMYRWDINVRMATVIGLVGGGGIGHALKQYMDLSQWSQAATAIWLIAGVVMVMDYASAVIREKVA